VSYEVKLEVFEGPFDLLLQLISKRKLEVTELDLADITSDFLAHMTELAEVDLETATRFIVVAATLIELKAARLLPREHREEVEDLLAEARDLLYARLLEYRAFRSMSEDMQELFAASERFVGREVPLETRFRRLVPDTTLGVDVHAIARLAALATAPPPVEIVDLAHVRRSTISIRDATAALLSRLAGGTGFFDDLADGRERHERVVFFLAALELYKLGHLDLDQPDFAGPLSVRATAGGHDMLSIADGDLDGIDEYVGELASDDGAGSADAAPNHVGSDTNPDDFHDISDDEHLVGELTPEELAADVAVLIDLTES
jgi:segregation and condensation protein A